jgi:hypothetical protein
MNKQGRLSLRSRSAMHAPAHNRAGGRQIPGPTDQQPWPPVNPQPTYQIPGKARPPPTQHRKTGRERERERRSLVELCPRAR